jgi:gliding motility-associated-like protein
MKNRFLLLIIFVFFLSFVSRATHIVGGSLTYEQLGGSTYRITLHLYRDCKAGSAAFPGTVDITVTNNCGGVLQTVSIPFPGASVVPPNIDTCAVNPGICLEEAVYTKVVSGLPPRAGGYDLYFQYCCHNSSLLNMVAPLSTGDTWYAHIPDNGVVIANSSPKWVNPPPVFVCQGNNMFVDHSATDADGDSLVYSLYTPYNGDTGPGALDPTWPGCVFTVSPITWSSTYGANNPLNAAVPGSLTINSAGIINGIPPLIGQFTAGVRCQEWRDGVKIGEILRDFQFNVVNCPPVAVAGFTYGGACNGLTINFNNTTSPAANSYLWDFGDASATSSATSPSHTYPALGMYTVSMIINNGTPCADTSIQVINLSTLAANFGNDAPTCKGIPVNFTDSTTFAAGSSITAWNWTFGDGFTSTLQNPSHPYGSGGPFNVTLITTSSAGCKDTIVYTVNIQGLPIANAGSDTISCTNNSSINLGGTILNAGGGQWIGSTGSTFTPGGTTSTVLNATYTPSAAAVASGADTLTLFTTSNGFCPSDTDQVIISFYAGPTVNAGPDIFVCKDTMNFPVSGSVTVASGGNWSTSGTGTFSPTTGVNSTYTPSSADTTTGSVMLYLTTTGNGNCIAAKDTTIVTFTSTPISIITSNDSSCAGNPLAISATTTNNTGIWTTNGTGTFAPDDTSLSATYLPSAADGVAGVVTMIFTSTNNGGCRSNADTLQVTLIPSPTAAFTSVSACPQDTVTFTDASTSTGSLVGWSWNFGDSGTSGLQNPIHIYGSGGPFIVSLVVTSNNGCVDTLTQTVNVFNVPVANFNANGVCLSDGTDFTDLSTVVGSTISSWIWSFGDGSTNGTTQNPIHSYPTSGSYTVLLTVQSAQGCVDTVSQIIPVLPGPNADFLSDDNIGDVGQVIHFTDQSTNAPVSWFWDFGDGAIDSTSTVQNPIHVYGSGGIYDVCLHITDINGCVDSICKQEIISMPPSVPSGFSPNGDGVNDIFFVYGGPFKKLDFKIYNNWGELIFESDKQSMGWDGKRKGIDQAIGVYVYTVVGVTEDDKEHKLSGDVTLLR